MLKCLVETIYKPNLKAHLKLNHFGKLPKENKYFFFFPLRK